MSLNEKYSYKSFKRKQFLEIDPIEFNDSEIIGSCFHQDTPYTDVFPNGIQNVIFTKCNLDNCNVPAGTTVNSGTNKQFIKQNDLEFWIVDKDLKPITPRDSDKFDYCGISKLPKDIPLSKLNDAITITSNPDFLDARKIRDLANDTDQLKAILIEKGDIVDNKLSEGVK